MYNEKLMGNYQGVKIDWQDSLDLECIATQCAPLNGIQCMRMDGWMRITEYSGNAFFCTMALWHYGFLGWLPKFDSLIHCNFNFGEAEPQNGGVAVPGEHGTQNHDFLCFLV